VSAPTLKDISAGQPISAAPIHANFQAIGLVLNANLDSTNFKTGSMGSEALAEGAVTELKLASHCLTPAKMAVGGDGFSVGTMGSPASAVGRDELPARRR
jgi:hypothetical protein